MNIELLLALPGRVGRAAILVENTKTVGGCAIQLASQFGYPVVSSTGTPLSYRLLTEDGKQVLPTDRSLADLQVGPGTCLLLDSVEARYTTVPLVEGGYATAPLEDGTNAPVRWTRRRVVLTTITGVAVAGLGAGWTFAVIGRIVSRRGAAIAPTLQAGITLRTVLRFSVHQHTVRSVAWSPDGTLLASAGDDGQVLVWTLDGMVRTAIATPAPVSSLAWSPESQRFLVATGKQVRFLSALNGSILAVRALGAQVTSVAWSRQGLAVSGLADTRAVIWQTTQYQVQTVFARHTTAIQAVTFTEDGQTVASSSQGGAVRVWSAPTGGELHPFYLDTRLPVPALAFAPVGATLAAGGNDGVIRLWDGLHCQTVGMSNQGPVCADVPKRLQQSHQAIRALAWSPDGATLASGSEDGTLTLWRPAQSHLPVFTLPAQAATPIHSITWAPDGKQVAAASGSMVTIWSVTG